LTYISLLGLFDLSVTSNAQLESYRKNKLEFNSKLISCFEVNDFSELFENYRNFSWTKNNLNGIVNQV